MYEEIGKLGMIPKMKVDKAKALVWISTRLKPWEKLGSRSVEVFNLISSGSHSSCYY